MILVLFVNEDDGLSAEYDMGFQHSQIWSLQLLDNFNDIRHQFATNFVDTNL